MGSSEEIGESFSSDQTGGRSYRQTVHRKEHTENRCHSQTTAKHEPRFGSTKGNVNKAAH